MERDKDRQLERLAAQLRDEGVQPQRDLWPEIDTEIARRETAGRRRPTLPWWRLAAAAAAVAALVLGSRLLLPGSGAPPAGPTARDQATAQVAAAAEPGPESGLETVNRALDELEAALAADPENLSLSRLVLMVHRARGELLSKTPTTGLRAG
jgi:AcrR family transcriptional regulator